MNRNTKDDREKFLSHEHKSTFMSLVFAVSYSAVTRNVTHLRRPPQPSTTSMKMHEEAKGRRSIRIRKHNRIAGETGEMLLRSDGEDKSGSN